MSQPPQSAAYSIEPYGETAVIILTGAGIDETAYRRLAGLAAAIKKEPPKGFAELVPAYDSLLFIFNPFVTDAAAVGDAIRRLADAATTVAEAETPEIVELPVAYGGAFGPDLETLAAGTGMSAREAVEIHSSKPYLVYMLGFTPGFPYLGGMDARIAAPRLATPRTKVPAGSVGIADAQTGVYPQESPGGWNLIGRTPLRLFDPFRQPPALLAAGKYVRFVPIPEDLFYNILSQPSTPVSQGAKRVSTRAKGITVMKPGPLSTVQDLGRFGFQDTGVPPSGPMDAFSMRAANILAGNQDDEACIECTLGGLELQFECDTTVAVTGAALPLSLDGKRVSQNRSIRVQKGSVLTLGTAISGLRAYVAIFGGLDTEPAMGSRSTFTRGGFGGVEGRRLAAGDSIPLRGIINYNKIAVPERIMPEPKALSATEKITARAVVSHERGRFTEEALASFFGQTYTVSSKSDRMGCRLEGKPLSHSAGADIVSSGVLSGTVQVPGDGQPIVLMADRQTTGGYTRIAHVIQADLGLLGQARPGSSVEFRLCSLEEAREALLTQEALLHDIKMTSPPGPSDCIPGKCRLFRVTVDGAVFDVKIEELH